MSAASPSDLPLVNGVAIPERMRRLDRDGRGYPVPWGVARDANGNPHFAVNTEETRLRCLAEHLCSICGGKLWRGRWWVGGPRSAFDPHGCYIDPPMHDDCARYALQVCPYLAAPAYGRTIGERKAARAPMQALILVDPTTIPDRPELFVAVMATGHTLIRGTWLYTKPKRPYRRIEYWRGGAQLPPDEGEALARRVMAETAP